MIKKLSTQTLRKIISTDIEHVSESNKNEMAIPSYLHKNFMIRWLMWKRYEHIAIMSAFSKDLTVLEFGCGIGVFLPELSEKCGKVFAIDLFPEYAMLLDEELNLNIDFRKDLSEIPANSLDIIIAADVLEHFDNDELVECLGLFSDRLKPNGRLILSGPTENIVYKVGRIIAGFSNKGEFHHTNVDNLIDVIGNFFHLNRTRYLPFRLPPFLFKVCEFNLLPEREQVRF